MNAAESLDFLEARERFLPVQTAAILDRLLEDPRFSPEEREQLKTLFQMILARFHFEFLDDLDRLKRLYDPFNPDRDTLPLCELSPGQRETQYDELKEGLRTLLREGNYVELTREQLVTCLEWRNRWGLAVRVNLDDYKELRVFYRGVRVEERTYRSWMTLYQKIPYTVHVFSRVAVLVRTRGEDGEDVVLVKLFKDVVLENLKMITPRVRIQMRLLDKLKIGSTVAGGLLTSIVKFVMAVAISPMLVLAVVAGCAGAFIRGVFSFLSSRTRYMQTLSSSLYFQSVANNISTLTRLVDAAEAEETKEMLLAYFILYVRRNRDYTAEQLDRQVERWLSEQFGLDVDFEVGDAVRKLVEKDLMIAREVQSSPAAAAQKPPADRRKGPVRDARRPRGVLKVYDLPTALRRLDECWDNYFSASSRRTPAEDRLADGDWPPYPSATSGDG